jgi:hypothetical protein
MRVFKNVALTFVICVSLFFINCSSGTYKAKVINKSDRPIKNLIVLYNGGLYFARHINKEETRKFTIKLTGESNLEVEYIDSQMNRYKCQLGAYFDYDYSGSLDIKIGNNGKISLKVVNEYTTLKDSIFEKDFQCDKKGE